MELGFEGGMVEGGLGAVEDAGALGAGFRGGGVAECASVCRSSV